MCSHCRVETIGVVMVWCARCKSKYLITSQAWLSWHGRHWKQMTNKKHVNNDQWKPWHTYINIQVSSDSLLSTQRPWRHTHCGGMVELFEKCWITTRNTPPLWILVLYCDKGGWIWKDEHNLSLLGEIVWSWHGHS
jgi:hypothetical protein